MTSRKTCSGPKCHRPAVARGLCSTHYQQWRRNGIDAVIEAAERSPSGTEPVSFRCERQLLAMVQEMGAQLGVRNQSALWQRVAREWVLFSQAQRYTAG